VRVAALIRILEDMPSDAEILLCVGPGAPLEFEVDGVVIRKEALDITEPSLAGGADAYVRHLREHGAADDVLLLSAPQRLRPGHEEAWRLSRRCS